MVTALLVGRAPDSDRVLLEKLSTVQRRHVGIIIEQLVQWPAPVSSDELTRVVTSLPQMALFEIFLEKKGEPEWDPQQRDSDADRARNWHQLAHLAERQLLSEPGEELVRQLVRRSAQDDAFARRHAAFLRVAMQSTDLEGPGRGSVPLPFTDPPRREHSPRRIDPVTTFWTVSNRPGHLSTGRSESAPGHDLRGPMIGPAIGPVVAAQ